MARYKKFDMTQLESLRKARRESQAEFWARFGATQSAGSRYESGRELPNPLKILVALWMAGTIDEADLELAQKQAGLSR